MKESSREEVLHPLATSTPVKGRFSCIDLNDSDSDESQDQSLSGLETPINKRPRLVDLNDSSSTCTEPSICSVVSPAKECRFGMKSDPEGAPILINIDDSTSNDPEDAVASCQEEQNSVDVKGKLTKAVSFQVPKISLKSLNTHRRFPHFEKLRILGSKRNLGRETWENCLGKWFKAPPPPSPPPRQKIASTPM